MYRSVFLLLVALIIQSCEDSSEPVVSIDGSDQYPLEIGYEWTYTYKTRFTDIRPDSIKELLENYSIETCVTVVTETLLTDSTQVYQLLEQVDDSTVIDAYYNNTSAGLMKYAYNMGSSSPVSLPKSNIRLTYPIREGIYFDLEDIINIGRRPSGLSKMIGDSIVIFDQPRVVYSYPLEIGTEWVYSSSYIFKKVTGKEIVDSDAGRFECFIIKTNYYFNGTTPDENFTRYEYLSAIGLLKSVFIVNDIVVTTAENTDGIGIVDMKQELILTSKNF